MKDEMSKDLLYWLAIKGASCAMSSMPLPATVTPLFGGIGMPSVPNPIRQR